MLNTYYFINNKTLLEKYMTNKQDTKHEAYRSKWLPSDWNLKAVLGKNLRFVSSPAIDQWVFERLSNSIVESVKIVIIHSEEKQGNINLAYCWYGYININNANKTYAWVTNLMFLSRAGSFLLFEWLIFILDHFKYLRRKFHRC